VEDLSSIRFPVIASSKIDGIRALVDDGSVWTSTLKLVPNEHVRRTLKALMPDGMDGELTPKSGDGDFQACTSAFMSRGGAPLFLYWLFDFVRTGASFWKRYDARLGDLNAWWLTVHHKPAYACVRIVPTRLVANLAELEAFMLESKRLGFEEGVIVRDPAGVYKCGRSTLKEGLCLKIKYRLDAEAEVIGFTEQQHNENPATKDVRGLTKRSSAKAGKVPAGTLGNFVVRDLKTGVEFEIGTGRGLDAELRKAVWTHRKSFLGKIVKYSYQGVGVKEKPRQPSFLGFRSREDMDS
jgi:DNA ligase-1